MKDNPLEGFRTAQIPSATTIVEEQENERDFEMILSTKRQKEKDIEFGFSRKKVKNECSSLNSLQGAGHNAVVPIPEVFIPPKLKPFHSSFLMRSNRLMSREDDSELFVLDHVDSFPQVTPEDSPQLPPIFTITSNLSPTMNRLTPIKDPNQKRSL
jgi:hypothetical protein